MSTINDKNHKESENERGRLDIMNGQQRLSRIPFLIP